MPLDAVSSSLSKPRREEALIRSTMALLSKVVSGKKFHLVKLNVGATNFVEDASKGTSSLLRFWAGKGTERDGFVAQRKADIKEKLAAKEAERSKKLDGKGAERDGSLPDWGAEKSGRRSGSPLGRRAERNGSWVRTEWKAPEVRCNGLRKGAEVRRKELL